MNDLFDFLYEGLSYDEMIDRCEKFAYDNKDEIFDTGENIGVIAFSELAASLQGKVPPSKYYELLRKAMYYSYMCGSYEESREFADQVLSVINSFDKSEFDDWNNQYSGFLFKLYFLYIKLKNKNMAYDYIAKANAFLEDLGPLKQYECKNAIEIKRAYASYLRLQNKLDDALHIYFEILAYLGMQAIGNEGFDKLNVAIVTELQAEIYVEQKLYDAAKFNFQTAYGHFSEMNIKKETVIDSFARCCYQFGLLYMQTDETNDAIELFNKAINLIEPIKHTTIKSSVMNTYVKTSLELANIYYDQKEYDLAENYFRETEYGCMALLFFGKGDYYGYLSSQCWAGISDIEKKRGDLNEALDSIEKSIDHATRFIEDQEKYIDDRESYYVECALLLKKLGRKEEALTRIDEAIALGTGNVELERYKQEILNA